MSIASLAVAVACLPGYLIAQAPWIELRGARFVLRGQLDPRELTSIACEAQEAARVVGILHGGTSMPSGTLSIIATGSGKGVRELLPQFWERRVPRPVGGYWSGLYGHHIVVRVDVRPEERFRRVLHEVAHVATHLARPDPPRWLDEGLSEIWENAAIDTGGIEIGRPVRQHVQRLRSSPNWIPVAELLTATSIPGRERGSNASMFYAESWALVHYLLFEKARGTIALDQLSRVDSFPTDAELRRYVKGAMAPAATIATSASTSGCAGPLEVRHVPDVESLVIRSRALADGERPDAALPLLGDALRREPGHAAALETLGFVHFVGNRPREAAAAFDRLISDKRASHVAYYYRAVLATAVPERTDGSGQVPELEYLREAIRLDPGFLPARDRLAERLRKLPVAGGQPHVTN